MLNDADTAILNLTKILFGNQANNDIIKNSLKLICNHASSSDGFIYGIDQSEQFCSIGCYTTTPNLSPARFFITEFTPQERIELAQKVVLTLQRDPKNTPLEIKLLNIYNVESLIMTPITDEDFNVYGFIVLLNINSMPDMTAQTFDDLSVMLSMMIPYISIQMYRKKIDCTNNSFASILDNTGIDIYVNDFNTHEVLYVNKSMAAPYGGPDKFIGYKCWQVLFPGQAGPCDFCPQTKLLDSHGNPSRVYSWDYQRVFDGSWFRVFSAAFYWIDGRLAHVVTSADITENKHNEALVENLANFDQLTKLPNRRMLLKECTNRIDKATAKEHGYVLFLDIDGFKAINDTLGHDAGDELLIQLGEFFSGIPLLKDSIYRNGGDEFVGILGSETITTTHVEILSNFILDRFQRPWSLTKGPIFCNTSIGIACYPDDGVTASHLLQVADMAMYQVKKSGGGGFCFGYQLDTKVPLPADCMYI